MNNSVLSVSVPNNNPASYCRLCFSQAKVVPIFPLGSNHNQRLIDQVFQWTGVQIDYREDFVSAICWKCSLTLEEFQRFCDRCKKNDSVIKGHRSSQVGQSVGKTEHHAHQQQQQQPPPQHPPNHSHQQPQSYGAPNQHQMDDRRFGYPLYPFMQPGLGYDFRLANEAARDRGPPEPHPVREPPIRPPAARSFHESHQSGTSGPTVKPETRIDIDTEFKHVFPVERLPEELVNMLDLPANALKRSNSGTSNGTTSNNNAATGSGAPAAANPEGTPPKPRNSQYQKTVESGGVMCPICKKPYTTDKNLKKHLRLHTLSLPFSCVDCGAKFSERRDYQKHQERYHGPNATASVAEIFHCDYCARVFTRQRDLTKHLRLFHEPPEGEESKIKKQEVLNG